MSESPLIGPDGSRNVRRNLFFLVVLIATVAFFGMIRHLVMACFWATVLAIIFKEPHVWLEKKLGNRKNLSAAITLLLITIIVVIPIGFVSKSIVEESIVIYESIETGGLNPQQFINEIQDRFPQIENLVRKFGLSENELHQRVIKAGQSIAAALGQLALHSTQNILRIVVDLALMLYVLFFFIRDGDMIVDSIKRSLPLGDAIEERLFKRFTEVSRATVKGTMIVAIVQGSLGGLIFAVLGIPGATLWGVIMIFLALLPVGGTSIVWLPASIILFAQGETVKALVLLLFGALIIGLVDNILRPRLVSRETHMPDYLVLLATLGGLASFGLAGFVVGPVIAALFITCWEITGQQFGGTAP